MSQIFTLSLHKTYAIIQTEKLTYLDESINDYSDLLVSISDDNLDEIFKNNLFLNTSDILPVIRRNLSKYQNSIITIVNTDLFNIYLNNKKSLNNNELLDIHKYLDSDLPIFDNIVDYEKLIEYKESFDSDQLKTPIYQLIGTINPFTVLSISVPDFVNFISSNKPILISLRNTRLLVSLQYEAYDFYDISAEVVDRSI
jgi:hypothetical protein